MTTDVFLTAAQVRKRYGGVSDMTVWRWLRSPRLQFPQPIYIAKNRYWRLADLEAWELSRAMEAA